MGLFDRLTAFVNRVRDRGRTRDWPEGAHVNSAPLPTDVEELPEWITILSAGEVPGHPDGDHEVTREHLEEMVSNFEGQSTDLLVDYDHGSWFGGDTSAAGWSPELRLTDEGLQIRRPEFTPDGEAAVSNREFRYLSPVYVLESQNNDGEEAGAQLLSVALTNTPYYNEGEIDGIGNSAEPAPNDSDESNPSSFMDREELIDLLGLDEDATDEEIREAVDDLQKARQILEGEVDEDLLPDEEDTDGEDDPEAESDPHPSEDEEGEPVTEEKVNALVDQKLEEREKEGRAEALVSAAIEQAKIRRSEKDVYLNSAKADYEGTKERLDNMVPGSAMPQGVDPPADPSEDAGGPKTNSRRDLINHLRAERAAA